MTSQDDLFAGEEPVAIFRRWLAEAERTEPSDPNAIALATVDASSMPNVRVVLLKEVEADGFVFYTNYHSAKGRELGGNANAAFVAHWKSLGRQVRVRGPVTRESGERADLYFSTRPLDSRIGAWASRQSEPLHSREVLMAEVARLRSELGAVPVRPQHWGGFRLCPVEVEFWAAGAFRLHDRFRWRRAGPDSAEWSVQRLSP